MSRERLRQTISLHGGVRPQVRRRDGGGCDIDLGGGTFDELVLDLTDEQAKAIRDKLCFAYGLPDAAAEKVRLMENPARPMDPAKLSDETLAICAYITWDWRNLMDLATSYPDESLAGLRAKLNMLTNAGLIEQRQEGVVREWRKRIIATKELSKEGRQLLALLNHEDLQDVFTLTQASGLTKGIVRSCLVQMREGGLVVVSAIEGSSALGYKRRTLM